MLVTVRLSPRRYLLLDCPSEPTAWNGLNLVNGKGYVYANADIISGPADFNTIIAAGAVWAAEHNKSLSYAEYEAANKERAERLKAFNKELQDKRRKP